MDIVIPYLKIFFIPEAYIPAIIIGVIAAVISFFCPEAEEDDEDCSG